jgi:hypothetical protein
MLQFDFFKRYFYISANHADVAREISRICSKTITLELIDARICVGIPHQTKPI